MGKVLLENLIKHQDVDLTTSFPNDEHNRLHYLYAGITPRTWYNSCRVSWRGMSVATINNYDAIHLNVSTYHCI
jgi:hypothetical protein